MLTSWSEVSTPAELSMKSVLTSPPAMAYSIRAAWVRPRLPPSGRPLRRPRGGAWGARCVRRPPAAGGGLVAPLAVGPDPAVPEQVHRRRQDGRDELVRWHRVHPLTEP